MADCHKIIAFRALAD